MNYNNEKFSRDSYSTISRCFINPVAEEGEMFLSTNKKLGRKWVPLEGRFKAISS